MPFTTTLLYVTSLGGASSLRFRLIERDAVQDLGGLQAGIPGEDLEFERSASPHGHDVELALGVVLQLVLRDRLVDQRRAVRAPG